MTVNMSELCGHVRPELQRLGVVAVPLLDALTTVECVGGPGAIDLLDDPSFVLDVLTTVGPGVDASIVARLLEGLPRAEVTVGSQAAGAVWVVMMVSYSMGVNRSRRAWRRRRW